MPAINQIRILFQGRFLPEDKTLKDFKVSDGETTAMHLVVKQPDAKRADAPSASDDKMPKCSCIIC